MTVDASPYWKMRSMISIGSMLSRCVSLDMFECRMLPGIEVDRRHWSSAFSSGSLYAGIDKYGTLATPAV